MSTETPYINRAKVKKLALHASRTSRGGKFTRVGSSFFERVNSQIASITAQEIGVEEVPVYINRAAVKQLAQRLIDDKGLERKLNGVILERINRKLIETVLGEVHRHPSVGKTLQ